MSAFALQLNRSGTQNTVCHCRYFRHGSQCSGASESHRQFCDNLFSIVELDDEDFIGATFYFLASEDLMSTLAVSYCHVQQGVEVEIDFSGFLPLFVPIQPTSARVGVRVES
jgi:hypothetical protein